MLYNSIPTIENLKQDTDESIQGKVFEKSLDANEGKKFYIESYGCSMNFSDSEIVASILSEI
ncbi:MAG TPA: hypothetical protein VK590_08570, partial [Saprospiraceae bacterium]|nr:hypothetical protein [Saprospiraceae bacterium]